MGSERCGACHAEPLRRWRGSHHDRAMQAADATSVLGAFDGRSFAHGGAESTFRERDGRFVVRTDGPDGALADFEIAYTFGVEPLQQYLVALPGGRLQALGIAWDARPAAEGGSRWFHLYPDETIPAGDVLHWTSPSQNWNARCAECHSTGLEKRYDPRTRTYDTRFEEIDVACEACHGPGSAHVAWAESGAPAAGASAGLLVDLARGPGEWRLAEGEAIAQRSAPLGAHAELDACGRCHARRGAIRDPYVWGRPLLDTHRPALLDPGLYHADGQIQDEVYEWGSFLQSRMYAAGVTCSDCHDPHALAIETPDAACSQCHRAAVFAAPEHHHHPPASAGASCVECHMPSRLYMQIDTRRDHSLRVPRPDLSLAIGTPNACTGCHADRSDAWAQAAVLRWWGPARASRPHYGLALHAGRRRLPGAEAALLGLAADASAPGIARATALRLLRGVASPRSLAAMAAGSRDPDPLVRLAAAEAGAALPARERLALAAPLLRDPILGVRIEAALGLSELPPDLWAPGDRSALAAALAEYRAAQRANQDFPEAHVALGALHARFGELEPARAEYDEALALEPAFVPARVNLADLHRQAGRDDEALRELERARELAPESADVLHALGLALVRVGRAPEAVAPLARAAELAPDEARYAYVHAIALHSTGDPRAALAALARAHDRHPGDREILVALARISGETGDAQAAARWAGALLDLAPDDPSARALADELGAASPRPD